MTLLNKLSQFILDHWDGHSPLLLALSGGPDSLVLLQLLMNLKANLHFQLSIAHVDHRWRPTSEAEAKTLEQHAKNLGLTFHLKTLSPEKLKGNLEAACRTERLDFFRELCLEYSYQAVLLGHHADDQAETVLKRIFEGVSLPYLTALRFVTCIDQLTLWRPLLNIPKKELISELRLSEFDIKPVEDETNNDPRFLRARFRTKLLPVLTKEFGKEIGNHLKNLSYEAQELNAYLDAKISVPYSEIEKGPLGSMLNFKQFVSIPLIEQKHLLRRFCQNEGIILSKEGTGTTLNLLITGASNKMISCCAGKANIFVDRYYLYVLNPIQIFENNSVELLNESTGNHTSGNWNVTVEKSYCEETVENTDWRDAWKGKAKVFLPHSQSFYTLASPKTGDCFPNSSPIGHWWNKNKVPVFMRKLLPVIYHEGKIIHEFLTGRTNKDFNKNDYNLVITLEKK